MQSFARPRQLLRLLALSASFGQWRAGANPSVNVALQASFEAPPFVLELLETAAEENYTSYFPLLDRIAEGRFTECGTDQELYDTFVRVLRDDGHITSPDALSSFDFALSIHSTAPRIEAHYQYYETSVEPSLMVAQDAACPVWVHLNGKQYCSPSVDLAQQDVKGLQTPETLPFDRVLNQLQANADEQAVLYADPTSPLFGQFYQTFLSRETPDSEIGVGTRSYRIRYRRSQSPSAPLAVNGYGVELALKRTDYIVIDDRKADEEGSSGASPSSESGAAGAHEEEIDDSVEELADLKPLSSSELLGLGLKTSTYIMNSKNPLETLERVSQDFPKYSSAIAKRNASMDVIEEHIQNREAFLPAGYNVIWMNGQQVQSRQMDAFSLLEQLRRERSIVANIRNLGFSGTEAVQILSHTILTESKTAAESQRYDYRDTIEGGQVIIWLNDIEKDKRYREWSKHTSALLQRLWPGQLPSIRRDIHNVVIPVDFSDLNDIALVVEVVQQFIKRKIPARFGLVPTISSEAAVDQAKIIYHLLETYGLTSIFAYLDACKKSKAKITAQQQNFESTVQDRQVRKDKEARDYTSILETEPSADQLSGVQSYLKRLGIEGSPPPFLANGIALARNEEWLTSMSNAIDGDLRKLQREVYEETVPEETWLAGRYLENAITHRNALIIPEDEDTIDYVDVGKLAHKHEKLWGQLPRLKPVETSDKPVTPQIYVVADLDSKQGLDLLREGVAFYRAHPDVELVLLHCPGDTETVYFPLSLMLADQIADPSQVLHADALDTLIILAGKMEAEGKANEISRQTSNEEMKQSEAYWQGFKPLVEDIGVRTGQKLVLVNGRIVGPIPDNAALTAEDFKQLLHYEQRKRLNAANAVLEDLLLSDRIKSPDQASVLVSTIALSTISDVPEGIFESAPTLRMDRFKMWAGDHTLIQVGEPDTSSIHLVASIDPTSQVAQRWIPILRVLSELDGVYLKLYLNPREKIQELPIKRFYRHVLQSKPAFAEDGRVRRLGATFDRLPRDALLNLALDVPPAWLVAPKESIHDLDNIKLSALKEGANVDAIYELEHILIEGHSRDVTLGPPPRGVQLVLGTKKDPYFADTIIMANIGYFQFKANPGLWNLRLQKGRSSKIFNIDSAGQLGYNPLAGDESTDITLMSFQGKTLYPRLSRRPGQEAEDVLEEGSSGILRTGGAPAEYVAKASSFASSILSKVGLGGAVAKPAHADINIFSVASGHLYERMLNIMMVSVMRHTTHTVKFWFIAQFLSPSFKASLPYLAAHYNFSYELITYKWPHWLRQQSEKQREIWGYKILFLDVLFPTSLDKVIFVDADQIVRTDMYDLVTHDLEGAPYGFTPMCDSRTEMEGFRFWKQGYWANFLKGLPYHISALYVVDLRAFREMAAGDRLRGQYHQLSADPGSLSNLDQDLPNHMQHVLPIHSLPQDWLWCETWCSDEALASARTIDLCNNPQTKEPKLSRARRQVPEWTTLDDEIAAVLKAAHGDDRAAEAEVRGGVQEVMIEGTGTGTATSDAPAQSQSGGKSSVKDEL